MNSCQYSRNWQYRKGYRYWFSQRRWKAKEDELNDTVCSTNSCHISVPWASARKQAVKPPASAGFWTRWKHASTVSSNTGLYILFICQVMADGLSLHIARRRNMGSDIYRIFIGLKFQICLYPGYTLSVCFYEQYLVKNKILFLRIRILHTICRIAHVLEHWSME